MENIKNNNATASIKLRDLLKIEPTLLDNLSLSTDTQTKKFKDMFVACFNDYEIGGETIVQFKQFMEDTFACNKDYFQEFIDLYEYKINFLDGYVSSFEEDTNTSTKDYNLPNKKVSDERGYLSDLVEQDINHTFSKKGGVNVVDQKFNYLNKLRNVYREFVEMFRPCFLLVY